MNGPLGLAGQRCMASMVFVAGSKLDKARQHGALGLAREVVAGHELCATAGVTSPNGQVMVLRVLAPVVEPAMDLLRRVWAVWRQHFWQLPATKPRIWSS
jgi:urease accessory protein